MESELEYLRVADGALGLRGVVAGQPPDELHRVKRRLLGFWNRQMGYWNNRICELRVFQPSLPLTGKCNHRELVAS